jgi:vacuolar-type H+-ATPase catalytic subunit A/Vma1
VSWLFFTLCFAHISGGINTQALDRGISWDFKPAQFKVGDHISGGDIFGSVYENSLIDNHKIMLPPRAMGTITNIVEKGSYTVDVSPRIFQVDPVPDELGRRHGDRVPGQEDRT